MKVQDLTVKLNLETDLDGEKIDIDRLRELAEADREGRINISQYPNCGMCKWVTVDMFAKREPCKSCKSRALSEKGEADGK
jgi:hypothetical protein